MHYLQTPAYWEASPSSYSSPSVIMQESVPGDMSTHESLYLSPEYSPSHEYSPAHSHEFHDPSMYNRARTPPPFNYASSSLHSALSISASPSSSYLSTPASGRPPELCNGVPGNNTEHPLPTRRPINTEPPPTPKPAPQPSQETIPISLGCTNIAVPVPFPDASQDAVDKQHTATSEPLTLRTDTESSPMSMSSPTIEDASIELAETSQLSENSSCHYRTAAEKRKAAATKPRRKAKEEGPPPRLSANLPVNSECVGFR